MTVKCFPGKFNGENLYVCYDETTKDAVVIDPGDAAPRAKAWAGEQGLAVRAVLLTHGHFDHISDLAAFDGLPVYAMAAEAGLLADSVKNYSADNCPAPLSIDAYAQLNHGDGVACGHINLTALHTPGHTGGGCCYYDAANGVLFSGDTLFFHSVGRSDLYTSDTAALERSIRDVLYKLPDETKVYPGHGARTNIGEEKRENPYVPEARP